MNFTKALFLVCFFFFGINIKAQEITSPGFGKGIMEITAQDNSFSMNISARIQGLFTTQYSRLGLDQNFTSENSSMMIRRARLKFSGYAYSPKLEYKLQLGLSNRDLAGASEFTHFAPRLLLDAVVMWNFYGNFELWAGQTKLPGNRESIISSGSLQFVDRSLLNSFFGLDRDTGLQLRHYFTLGDDFVISEAFAFSQGEGRNITEGNLGGNQYTARLEVMPFGEFLGKGAYSGGDLYREPAPKLALGFTYDFNQNAVRSRSNAGGYLLTDYGFHETDISSIFLDAMFKYEGFSVMSEYAYRTAEDPVALHSDGLATSDFVSVGSAFNFQTGYLFKNNIEVAARYTNLNLDKEITGANTETQYTLGVSKYIVGHKLKIQSDLSYNDWDNTSENDIIFRLQFEVHF